MAIAVGGALALAGCNGGGDEPTASTASSSLSSTTTSSASSTTTASPSTTTSATIDPAKLPPEATEKTEAGAKAFAKFFVETLDQSQVEADPSTLVAISEPECQGCKIYVDLSRELAVKGQHQEGPALELSDIGVRSSSDGRFQFDLLIDERPTRTVDKAGAVVASFPADKTTLRVDFNWISNQWRVKQAVVVV
jgi:hypothetical protein